MRTCKQATHPQQRGLRKSIEDTKAAKKGVAIV